MPYPTKMYTFSFASYVSRPVLGPEDYEIRDGKDPVVGRRD